MPERPLRVAIVNHVARLGGAEFALLAIAEHLDGRAVEPLVVLGEEGPLAERLRAASVEVVVRALDPSLLDRRKETLTAGGLLNPLPALSTLRAAFGLGRYLRRREIDLIHTNSLKANLLGGVAGRLAGIPVVWHVRDHLSAPYLPRAAVPFVRLAARALPRRVVAVSHSAARTVGRSDVVVVHQGISVPARAPEPPAGAPRVGLVGRISPWKGQDVFLDAAARLAPQFPDARFVLAGSPLFSEEDYERELHQRAEALGIAERVDFLGFRDDVWQVYRELHVVVHASTLAEPYGNVVLEAMASARPIVAAAAGGVLELVDHGRTGLLTPPGDPIALAEAIASLLRSPEERHRLAAEGRREVERRFSVDDDAAGLEHLWREVAARAGHA